jgi:hypothetical protein
VTERPPLSIRPRPEWQLPILVLVGAGLGVGLGQLTLAPARVAIVGMVVLVLLAAALFVSLLGPRVGLFGLLIATCFIDRFTFSLGTVDIRAEQVAALLGLGLVGFWIVSRRRGWDLLRPNLSEALLGLWFVLSLVSSVTAAPEKSRSVKAVGLLLISSLGFLLPRRLLGKNIDRGQLETVVKLLLIAFAAEGAYGTGAFLAHVFGPTVSISANGATGHLSAYGTLWEPNVFGAFCAAGAVAWAWLGPRHFRLTWLGMALCLGGTLVSFTRAAWATAVLVLVISLLGPLRQRANFRQLVLGAAGAAVIAIAVFGAEHAGDYYQHPYQHPLGVPTTTQASPGLGSLLTNSVDVIGRFDQVLTVFTDLSHHPLLGNGTASFGERHPIPGLPEQHIANLELSVLNDTGALGLVVFAAFGAALAVAVWRRRRDPTVAGLGMATLVIAITNTATETTELMIFWLMLGLVMMAVDAARPAPSNLS